MDLDWLDPQKAGPPQMTFLSEQLEQETNDIAIILGEYYNKLKEQNIPIELINLLVVQFHNMVWQYSLVSKYK